ncbi:hypothetical protein MKX03_027383 [Papaver bracteatum]|nr:hypothetical protein MKX03_027383 [Papaver bracteatum]
MKTCLQQETSIHSYIAKILKGGEGEPAANPCLKDCLNLYSDDVHYSSANIQMTAAMNASTNCEDGFKEVVVGRDLTSPLAKQDGDFFQLAGISLAITHMV